MATRTPKAALERRIKVLQALLDGPFEKNQAELGRRLGYKDGSLVGQFLRGERPISEGTEEKMLKLPETKLIPTEIGGAKPAVAQPVSQAVAYPSVKSWEEVMHRDLMPQWPTEVTVVVPDRALEPHVMRGDHLTFERCDVAEPTNVVVLETDDGARWIRRLVRKADGSLWGVPDRSMEDAFPPFKADKILARATRRSTPFNGF